MEGWRPSRQALVGGSRYGGPWAAMALLAWAPGIWAVVAAASIHGLAWGLRGPLMGALRVDYFGRESFAMIMGLSSTIVMTGSVGGPLVAGLLADATGGYSAAFSVLSLTAVIGAAAFFLVGPAPARKSAGT